VLLSSLHKTHHESGSTLEARDVLRHSPFDAMLQVVINIVVQRSTPWGGVKSRLARAVHNVVVTWMLTESHTASPTPNLARRFFTGVRRHREHHLRGTPNYQQFFSYLDDLSAGWDDLSAGSTKKMTTMFASYYKHDDSCRAHV